MASKGWVCYQDGSRELYAVPRCLHRRGRLTRMYTAAWCGSAALRAVFRRCPEPMVGFARRYHPDLAGAPVTAFNLHDAFTNIRVKFTRRPLEEFMEERWTLISQLINRHLDALRFDPSRHSLFAFLGFSVIKHAKSRGFFTVMDQIDPATADYRVIDEEMRKWPGWASKRPIPDDRFLARLRETWRTADAIVVNSDWSMKALTGEGVPAEKIFVIPLAYEPEDGLTPVIHENKKDPLQVLWLGQVVLRKGIPYLFEAARLLPSVQFTVAGWMGISESAVRTAPSNLTLLGKVDRARAHDLFRRSDVFALPTMSDGFALTQLEAMAHGMPVIATERCGRVVTEGQDGFIVPAGDAKLLAAAIDRFDSNRSLIPEFSRNAAAKSRLFTLDRYADALEAVPEALAERNRAA